MGLRGPLPKDPSQRASRKIPIGDIPSVELVFEPGTAPDLPTQMIDKEGTLIEIQWSPLTLDWWNDWRSSPQAKIFSVSDWRSLLTTALVANQFYVTNDVRYASELRQREAQYGATPLDRLRLRMAWLESKEKEKKSGEAQPTAPSKSGRYGDLRVAGDAG